MWPYNFKHFPFHRAESLPEPEENPTEAFDVLLA
jgi:hypothetical protein